MSPKLSLQWLYVLSRTKLMTSSEVRPWKITSSLTFIPLSSYVEIKFFAKFLTTWQSWTISKWSFGESMSQTIGVWDNHGVLQFFYSHRQENLFVVASQFKRPLLLKSLPRLQQSLTTIRAIRRPITKTMTTITAIAQMGKAEGGSYMEKEESKHG